MFFRWLAECVKTMKRHERIGNDIQITLVLAISLGSINKIHCLKTIMLIRDLRYPFVEVFREKYICDANLWKEFLILISDRFLYIIHKLLRCVNLLPVFIVVFKSWFAPLCQVLTFTFSRVFNLHVFDSFPSFDSCVFKFYDKQACVFVVELALA